MHGGKRNPMPVRWNGFDHFSRVAQTFLSTPFDAGINILVVGDYQSTKGKLK